MYTMYIILLYNKAQCVPDVLGLYCLIEGTPSNADIIMGNDNRKIKDLTSATRRTTQEVTSLGVKHLMKYESNTHGCIDDYLIH